MRIKVKVGTTSEHAGWNTVKIFGMIVVMGALVSSSSRGVVKPPPSGPKTVIPAHIRAAQVEAVSVTFGARVVQILVAAGAEVKAGQPLMVLESEEVEHRIDRARRRLAVAELRIKPAARRKPTSAEQLEARTAHRSLELAKQRLAADSLTDAEAACAAAKANREKVAALVARQMATSAELDAAAREEQNELRNLTSAREHRSRLEQEIEAYETQVALIEARLGVEPQSGQVGADLDLAEARAELESALRNRDSLQLKAPRDGVVLSSVPSPGDRVFAGAPMLYIADLSRLSFEAPVSALIARQVRPGMTVRLRVPTEPPRQVDAEVSSVALAPDPIQQSYVVRAVIGNPDRNVILVGMEGAMEFPHGESLWRRLF